MKNGLSNKGRAEDFLILIHIAITVCLGTAIVLGLVGFNKVLKADLCPDIIKKSA